MRGIIPESNIFFCEKCDAETSQRPTLVEFGGQEVYLFNPVLCEKCLLGLCEKYSVSCANCGGVIPPYTQVGVLKDDGGRKQFVHMTTVCSTVGSAFHGYLGKGELGDYVEIEAC